jgi:hypothetical protein
MANKALHESINVVLDKFALMREELLNIERALERMQREGLELTIRRDGSKATCS